jgi:serine/threonine-protein kinase
MVPLVVLAAFAVATALGTSALAQVGTPGRATPGLVGLAKPAAISSARGDGLTLHIRNRASSDPAGVVIEQNPAPGEWLYGARTVDVVLSSGPPPIGTPVVTELARLDAIAKLKRAGLLVHGLHGFDQTARVGDVFRQDPQPGQAIRLGQTVTITWSDGPPPVTVPDVHGETCTQAKTQLAADHLRATCTDVFDDTTTKGQVITTVPGPRTTQQQNTTIAIRVSKGPELIAVPDLQGLKVTDAMKKLTDLGFKVSVPSFNPKGHVFDQSPAAGKMIPKGSTVTLIL